MSKRREESFGRLDSSSLGFIPPQGWQKKFSAVQEQALAIIDNGSPRACLKSSAYGEPEQLQQKRQTAISHDTAQGETVLNDDHINYQVLDRKLNPRVWQRTHSYSKWYTAFSISNH